MVGTPPRAIAIVKSKSKSKMSMINTHCPCCAEHWCFGTNDYEAARRYRIHQEQCEKKQEQTVTIRNQRTGATFEMTVAEFKERFPQAPPLYTAPKQVFRKTIALPKSKTDDEDPSNV